MLIEPLQNLGFRSRRRRGGRRGRGCTGRGGWCRSRGLSRCCCRCRSRSSYWSRCRTCRLARQGCRRRRAGLCRRQRGRTRICHDLRLHPLRMLLHRLRRLGYPFRNPGGMRLLHNMRQFMCQQAAALAGGRGKPAGSKRDVASHCISERVHGPGRLCSACVGVNTDAGEILAKPRLEECLGLRIERLPGERSVSPTIPGTVSGAEAEAAAR